MSDRNLGYSVIFFCIIFVLIVSVYLSSQFLTPVYHRTILFDSVNTLSFLKKEDPVCIRGIETGHINNIFWKNGKTYVEIQTKRPLKIHSDYRVIAEAKGFMGDRYLEIDPGDMNAPLFTDKEPLTGFFPLGPTEAIALSGKMNERVRSLMALTEELRTDSPGKPSFSSGFKSLAKQIDNISVLLTDVVRNVERWSGKNADTLAFALKKADNYTKTLNSTVPVTIEKMEIIMKKTKKILIAVDSLTISTNSLLDRLKSGEAFIIDNNFRQLQKKAESIRNSIKELQEEGLRLPINL
ncbi:MAG: MlaD family protein [Chitinispirillaceae bacterium]